MALTNKLEAIGDAIRGKTGKQDKLTLEQMVTEINSITTGEGGGAELPAEAFVITGNCNYRFASNGWNWFINNYGDRITTSDISSFSNMFLDSSELTEIPLELNAYTNNSNVSANQMFYGCLNLTKLPKMNNFKPGRTEEIFYNCKRLREIPEDIFVNWDWNYIESQTSGYAGNRSKQFFECNSLRSFPMSFLEHANPASTNSYSIYSGCFNACNALDEVADLPLPHTAIWTSNAFGNTFSKCYRLKRITFALQEDGTPYTAQWKSQLLDLSDNIGHYNYSSNSADTWGTSQINSASTSSNITIYNSGITTDKCIYNAETYETLKNDPDSYCLNSTKDGGARYSRYNHDSAVETINTLPDTSAYLASAGGTNTIKFLGAAGSLTDGGAISNLTEEEIAVATAKGWTVTFK